MMKLFPSPQEGSLQNLHGFMALYAPRLRESALNTRVRDDFGRLAVQWDEPFSFFMGDLQPEQVLAGDFYNLAYQESVAQRARNTMIGVSVTFGALGVAAVAGYGSVLSMPLLCLSGTSAVATAYYGLRDAFSTRWFNHQVSDGQIRGEAPQDKALFRRAEKLVTGYLTTGHLPPGFTAGYLARELSGTRPAHSAAGETKVPTLGA